MKTLHRLALSSVFCLALMGCAGRSAQQVSAIPDVQKIGNATTGDDMLYVVTGPIFESGYGTTKDKTGADCAVATHYFKCIMKVTYSGSTPSAAVGAAYLLDHQSGATRQNVTIDYIEQLTGFNFFAHVPTDLQNAAEAETHPTSYFPQKSTSTSE